jgi:hypothetical protein
MQLAEGRPSNNRVAVDQAGQFREPIRWLSQVEWNYQ